MIVPPLQKENKVKGKIASPTIQTKLTIGSPNDKYEREADSMADQIMRMPQTYSNQPLSKGAKDIQRKCTNCEKEEDHIHRKPLMMKSESGTPVAPQALSSQLKSTKGSGSPLPPKTNRFMSQTFGADFSNVRVHTNRRAQQMNQGLNARAFTHGSDVYFNRGKYNPGSLAGKRLLGHELTHVVQQGNTSVKQIQRESPPAPIDTNQIPTEPVTPSVPRKDVVFIMAFGEAAQLASSNARFFTVQSTAEMGSAIDSIDFPIGTMYFFSHSTATAKIKFAVDGYVSMSMLALLFKDKIDPFNTPQSVDFRGCSVGLDPSAMETFRKATGASSVIGSDCYMVFKTLPFTVDEVHINKWSQLKNPRIKVTWDEHFKNHWKRFPSKDCVVDRSANAYFKAGGFLVSVFANKKFTEVYTPSESICYKDLTTQILTSEQAITEKPSDTGNCKLIRVEKKVEPSPLNVPSLLPDTKTAEPEIE